MFFYIIWFRFKLIKFCSCSCCNVGVILEFQPTFNLAWIKFDLCKRGSHCLKMILWELYKYYLHKKSIHDYEIEWLFKSLSFELLSVIIYRQKYDVMNLMCHHAVAYNTCQACITTLTPVLPIAWYRTWWTSCTYRFLLSYYVGNVWRCTNVASANPSTVEGTMRVLCNYWLRSSLCHSSLREPS